MSDTPSDDCLAAETIRISRAELPLSCPLPGTQVWNLHPRVYLRIEDSADGAASCPYCGARYLLRD